MRKILEHLIQSKLDCFAVAVRYPFVNRPVYFVAFLQNIPVVDLEVFGEDSERRLLVGLERLDSFHPRFEKVLCELGITRDKRLSRR